MIEAYHMNKIYALKQNRISARRLCTLLGDPLLIEEFAQMLHRETCHAGGRWQVRIAPVFVESDMIPVAMIEEAWEHAYDLGETHHSGRSL